MPDQDESAQAPAAGPSRRKKRYLIGIAVTTALAVVGLFVAGAVLSRRFDPYIREQAILYLQERFDSEVELEALRIRVPMWAPLRLLLFGGQGALVRIEGDNLSLRHRGRRDLPPMFVVKTFTASADLGTIFSDPKTVTEVTLDGMAINVPPKAERPALDGPGGEREEMEDQGQKRSSVIVEKVIVRDAKLAIFPSDKNKVPLRFDLHDIRLESAGKDVAMRYAAVLTNPKPPGDIESMGTFGPWASGEPGDTPLGGEYLFENADLGIFKGIAGILRSTGTFEGTLSSIAVRGEASVPDFRLKRSDNPVPLSTTFEALVDGTNGNTVLKPVVAKLGSTDFTTSGVVVKHEGDVRRTISLRADMPRGSLRDVLRLAVKGSPFMEGTLMLDAQIDLPPLTGTVKEKLRLEGKFEITDGKFLRSGIQSKIDALSRRGQGKPKSTQVDEIVHRMSGEFDMADEVITFRTLAFEIEGAAVNIGGTFDMGADELDFHGALMLDAKVSQTVTGWRSWVLKPLDPFFSKRGAGTFLHIKVEGSAKDPQFGLAPGGTSPAEEAEKAKKKDD